MATVLGAMMSLQYHDVLLGGAGIWSSSPDVAAVNDRLEAVTAYNQMLSQRIQEVQKQVISLQNQTLAQGGGVADLERQLHAVKVLAGTVPVAGPGVEVMIDDGKMSSNEQEQFITHDWDLRSVVNELFLAGADAVAVNDARITSTTGIFCIGPVVRVGNMRLGPPFIIRAIGDPKVLAAALNFPGGVLDALRGANRGLAISTPSVFRQLRIPAYVSSVTAANGGAQG